MQTIKSLFTGILRRLPTRHRDSRGYDSPISIDELTGEYLLLEIPDTLSPDAEAAVATLLTETHRNGFTAGLTDSEGYPSLFPPGASLFDTDGSGSRLQDVVSVLDRFTHVFHRQETDVIVLNAARIEENIRIAEHDPGRSGRIAQRNIDALAASLAALSGDHARFVDGDVVPASTRDSHLITFQETVLYR
ncbi:hypothetical protein [Halalkalicoccus paucihalophilus]|nr:hypothetical protein [Halalkalicoccus paucihalophilus]